MSKNHLEPFNILIAMDSFKECLSATEVCKYIEEGLLKAQPNLVCVKHPMADGGEGTLEAMVKATEGSYREALVLNPLGNQIQAKYGLLGDGDTALIEMARASGIELLSKEERNPLVTTSFGTGQLIKAALDLGVKNVLIGIGGTATNDGGVGALQALGAQFLDKSGRPIGFGGGQLDKISTIDLSKMDSRIASTRFIAACDVDNPLLGERGASSVFAPQKGANGAMVAVLENNLRHLSHCIGQLGYEGLDTKPGAGAAGGMGYAILTLLGGQLEKGVELVMKYSHLEQRIQEADWVITGEGRLDHQTRFGKVPFGVAKLCKIYNKPVIGLAGQVKCYESLLEDTYLDACFSIQQGVGTLEEAFHLAPEQLSQTAEQLMRLLLKSQTVKNFQKI